MSALSLNLLNLDLDWFNVVETSELPAYIHFFFRRLVKACRLPKEIFVLAEHHYVYPWAAELARARGAKKIRLINIDAHHDFYRLKEIKDFSAHQVGCGNFFAFLAHDGLLERYTWITNHGGLASSLLCQPELIQELEAATSPQVRRLKVRVYRRLDVWRVLSGVAFQGFAIIGSPGYTRTGLVQRCVRQTLQTEFAPRGFRVTRSRHAAEFKRAEEAKFT